MSMALRVDATTGIEERLEHLPSPHGLLYSWTARPPQAAACVVICSAILGDFTANYHRERSLGRSLAAYGLGVIRFHYAGEGNSLGDRRTMTFETMCDDTRAVLAHATSLGFESFGLLGTRLGALVAARAISAMESAPLALWEPVTDPLRFIRDAQLAKRMSQLAQQEAHEVTDWQQELEHKGVFDLFGYTVYRDLIESLRKIDLVDALGPKLRPVFVARFRARDAAIDKLSDELITRGFPVASHTLGVPESWWLQNEDVIETHDLIASTSEWLNSLLLGTR